MPRRPTRRIQGGDLTPQLLRRSLRFLSQLAGCLQAPLDLWPRREAPLQLLDPAERPLQPVLLLPLHPVSFGVVGDPGEIFELLGRAPRGALPAWSARWRGSLPAGGRRATPSDGRSGRGTASRSASPGASVPVMRASISSRLDPGLLERFETGGDAVLGADLHLAQLAPAVQVRSYSLQLLAGLFPRRRLASRPLRSRGRRGDGSRPPASSRCRRSPPAPRSRTPCGRWGSAPRRRCRWPPWPCPRSWPRARRRWPFPCDAPRAPAASPPPRAAPAPPAPGPRRRRGPRGPPRARRLLPAPPRYDSSASRTLLRTAL